MSIQAMGWVLEHSQAEGGDRLVLLAIANHADAEGGLAWPSVNRIAFEARVSIRSVYRSLERLEGLGELEVRRGGGRGNCNTYQLKGDIWSLFAGKKTVTSRHETVTSGAINGDTAGTRTVSNRHEPNTREKGCQPDTLSSIKEPSRCMTCQKLEFDCLCDRGPLIKGVGRR